MVPELDDLILLGFYDKSLVEARKRLFLFVTKHEYEMNVSFELGGILV